MPKSVVYSAEKSARSLRSDAHALSKSINSCWGVAKKAPIFLRKPKFVGSGKNKTRMMMKNRFGTEVPIPPRANRCVRSAVYKTLLSGAAANANQILLAEANDINLDVTGELSVAAALPKLSVGAEIMLEHALVAYTKTVFDSAARIKESVNSHAKVSIGCMQAAVEIVNRNVFGSSGIVPGNAFFEPNTRKKGKKAIKEKSDADADADAEADAEAEKKD